MDRVVGIFYPEEVPGTAGRILGCDAKESYFHFLPIPFHLVVGF